MSQYDAIIIGAGMSGLAAGIRLAMFDKKVCIIEKHTISGGLNSYYRRRSPETKDIVEFDAGLHALTNFVPKGIKGAPLTKLLKQLRIPHGELKLCEQSYSQIDFKSQTLNFNNDFKTLEQEISKKFPQQRAGFDKLLKFINEFDETALDNEFEYSRDKLKEFISDELLIEMLLAPLLIYGSAWEHDMDFSQFVIMFKSIYMEGFARPEGGVRTILKLLLEKYESLGGEIRFRTPVESIDSKDGSVCSVTLKEGEILKTKKIFSSIGLPETQSICKDFKFKSLARVGKMGFMESIIMLDRKVDPKDFDQTIIFYNDSDKYHYEASKDIVDFRSAVICTPDNYEMDKRDGLGCMRVTYMANYDKFNSLEREDYLAAKMNAYEKALELVKSKMKNFDYKIILKDVFSPTTIERYTWHHKGTIYGSPDKARNGKSEIKNLFIIGTDQGFLGIIGSMLSGISIANLYGLMDEV